MTKKPSKLDPRYRDAQARTDKAEQETRRASRERLAELKRLPARERLAHVEDRALTAEDRKALLRSVTVSLPARKVRFRWRQRAITWLRLPARLSVIITIATTVVPLGAWATMTWLNTGHVYQFNRPMRITLHYPSGDVQPGVIPAGAQVVVVQHMVFAPYARTWLFGQGYATANLPHAEFKE